MSGTCHRCGKLIARWPERWGVDVTLYCPDCPFLTDEEEEALP